MATATSNLTQLRLVPELIFGQIPATGPTQDMRFTDESLGFTITTEQSQEIRSDRQVSDLIQTGAEAGGDINFELSYGTFDELFAGALASEWVNDELINGVQLHTWAIEQGFTDVQQYIAHLGMGVNTLALEFSIDAIITGSFSFMGAESVRADSTQLPTPSLPATTTEVMDSVSGFDELIVNGQSFECGISRVALNITNNLRAQKSLGKLGACEIKLGTLVVTGEIAVYFADGDLYDRYIRNESVQLSWKVRDRSGNEYAFDIPRLKFTDGTVNAEGLDSDVVLTLPFQALLDPTTGKTISISRTPAAPPVPGTPPTNTTAPVVTGTTEVGETLTATPGVWAGTPTPTVARQWLRGTTPIAGETGLTYVLVAADEGETISVRETATNSEGTDTVTSAGVGPVTA